MGVNLSIILAIIFKIKRKPKHDRKPKISKNNSLLWDKTKKENSLSLALKKKKKKKFAIVVLFLLCWLVFYF